MPRITDIYHPAPELVLGTRLNTHVPVADQQRQRDEVEEILRRLRNQPGVILADEVGMGKTFVALAIAYSVAVRSPRGPVIVMVPPILVDKWEQDLQTFCELYLEDRKPIRQETADRKSRRAKDSLRYGIARHSVDLMKLLDDPPGERCHLIFLKHGAMSGRQSDKWIRLALIAEALRRHGRGKASRLIQVKSQIHRFLAELLWAIGEERAHDWGEDLWRQLLQTATESWKDTYNHAVRDVTYHLADDPVPKSVARALSRIDLKRLAQALEQMPVRASGDDVRHSERLDAARQALREVEVELWKDLLAEARWRSPLLVMDEAHHLKNPGTSLARQLQSPDAEQDLRTGDGAMAQSFDRMLFLTATPFQLGHFELVRVLERFGDVRWDLNAMGDPENFRQELTELGGQLNESQRTAIALQRSWSRLRPEDCEKDVEAWWDRLIQVPGETLSNHQRAVVDAFRAARSSRDAAQQMLGRWIVRHNKRILWSGTSIFRRQKMDGAAIAGQGSTGLAVPPQQLLPFFLAARSAVNPRQDLLGEALCSSYEAFRFTRQNRIAEKDEQDEPTDVPTDLSHSRWYLGEFDWALERCSGSAHPKIHATVRKTVDLWEAGEKVLVFAFYLRTCRALRVHISQEIERRMVATAVQRLNLPAQSRANVEIEKLLERIQSHYFDRTESPGRKALDAAISEILMPYRAPLAAAEVAEERLSEVMRKFLRVATTLVRCFPIAKMDSITPAQAVAQMLDHTDDSKVSWRQKFGDFVGFFVSGCLPKERQSILDAALRTQTGSIRDAFEPDERLDESEKRAVLANVRVATGKTKRDTLVRLMRSFNTPFFPDILVCSQVMGEGVDLQRFCRHVIHHDLDWNPSKIEQRTGRLDRLGCKAQGRDSIVIYRPYLAGTADERQYKVMSEREQWFRVVMGQDEVANLITPESSGTFPLPDAISAGLSFKLSLVDVKV